MNVYDTELESLVVWLKERELKQAAEHPKAFRKANSLKDACQFRVATEVTFCYAEKFDRVNIFCDMHLNHPHMLPFAYSRSALTFRCCDMAIAKYTVIGVTIKTNMAITQVGSFRIPDKMYFKSCITDDL